MKSFGIERRDLRPNASSILLLGCLLTTLLHTQQIHALNGDSVPQEIQNAPYSLDTPTNLELSAEGENYEPDFLGLDRSIIGRAEGDDQALANNDPGQLNIEQGKNQYWTFPKQALLGPQSPTTSGLPSNILPWIPTPTPNSPDDRILYISLTTCLQPNPNNPKSEGAPDQLKLYVSTNPGNQQPSLTNNDYAVPVDGGFGWLNISVKGDVYFGISAPSSNDFTGVYNYQLTASIDGFYASYINMTYLNFIDSDTSSALLYTNNVTNDNSSAQDFQEWMGGKPRFSIFAQNQDNPSILGLQRSICALQDLADVRASTAGDTSMTLAGNGQPKQQFYVPSLNRSSSYYAMPAMIGNSTASGNGVVGGGGIVWDVTNFKTKSRGSTIVNIECFVNPFCI